MVLQRQDVVFRPCRDQLQRVYERLSGLGYFDGEQRLEKLQTPVSTAAEWFCLWFPLQPLQRAC